MSEIVVTEEMVEFTAPVASAEIHENFLPMKDFFQFEQYVASDDGMREFETAEPKEMKPGVNVLS